MGAQIVRFDVNWPSIQAGGPTSYNWAPFDAVVVERAPEEGLGHRDLRLRSHRSLGHLRSAPPYVWDVQPEEDARERAPERRGAGEGDRLRDRPLPRRRRADRDRH